jgi:mannitol-1-phosphate 5-dehydrogenase
VSTVVVIGAGRIACGQLAPALMSHGHDVVLVSRTPQSAAHLGCADYELRLSDGRERFTHRVAPREVICVGDTSRIKAALADADVVVTAVLPSALPAVAERLAPILAARLDPLPVLCLDNVCHGARRLRCLLVDAAADRSQARRLARHHCGGVLAARIVTHRRWCPRSNRLIFIGDRVDDLIVDAEAPPAIAQLPHATVTDELDAHVLRKLYTFSAGHVAAAYLGSLKGYRYIHAAVRDPEIRRIVYGAIEEGRLGVAALFGPTLAGSESLADEVLARLDNAHLEDQVDRVGRDPRRKLAASDRILGAARAAEAAGVFPENLLTVAAAALCYWEGPTVPLSLPVQIADAGIERVVRSVCALESTDRLAQELIRTWRRLSDGWFPGNSLLSLEPCRWAVAPRVRSYANLLAS